MAALAYVAPPVTGLIAFLTAADARVRFHGLQSIVFGAAWPAGIYLGAALLPAITRVVFLVGAVIWVVLLVSTAAGRDLGLPGLKGRLRSLASYSTELEES